MPGKELGELPFGGIFAASWIKEAPGLLAHHHVIAILLDRLHHWIASKHTLQGMSLQWHETIQSMLTEDWLLCLCKDFFWACSQCEYWLEQCYGVVNKNMHG